MEQPGEHPQTRSPTEHLLWMMDAFPTALAKNTYNGYLRLATRFEAWAQGNSIPKSTWWDQGPWTTFVTQLGVTPQGTHGYLKVASAVLATKAKQPLQMATAEARAAGALKPIRQAPPLLKEELHNPVLLEPIIRFPLLVGWKSSSRWDEVGRLLGKGLTVHEEPELMVIIDWDQATKASRLDPHRSSRYAVIVGDGTAEIAAFVRNWPPDKPITELTTSQLSQTLKRVRAELSAHSVKAGAVDVLARAVAEGRCSEVAMCRLAKHARLDDLPSTTLRYVRDAKALALLLRTQEASRML
jgi:hypothetical protein